MDTVKLPEISCDRCVAPGTCCKSFPISSMGVPLGTTPQRLQEMLNERNLPFNPQRRDKIWASSASANGTGHQWNEEWHYTCPKLGEGGRCTIYEERPSICRVYEAGVDIMCVHMRLPDGNPIIPQLPIIDEIKQ